MVVDASSFQGGVTSIRQNDGADQMKKLSVLGIIGGAALLTAAPFSLQWSQKNVALSLDSADARIGRPGTALSVAGVHRRAYRRAARSTVYGGAAGAVGYGLGSYYGGYGYPAYSYSAPYAPNYGTGLHPVPKTLA